MLSASDKQALIATVLGLQKLRFKCRRCKTIVDFTIQERFHDLPPGTHFTICPSCGVEGIETEKINDISN